MQCGHPEYDLQCQCKQLFYLLCRDGLFVSSHNESAYKRKDYFIKSGLVTGFPDVTLLLPNSKIVFIEFKAPKPHTARLSLEQKQIGERLKKLGFEYYVIRDFDEFQTLIKEKLNTTND